MEVVVGAYHTIVYDSANGIDLSSHIGGICLLFKAEWHLFISITIITDMSRIVGGCKCVVVVVEN